MPDDRFARTVHDWLTAAAPSEAPDRILDAVAARIDELEQPTGPRWPRFLAAAVFSVVVLGGALVFAGISRPGSPAPSASAAPSASLIRCETAPCSFTLTAGTEYASSAFDLSLTLRAPSDRWLVDYDQPGLFRLVVGRDERRNITILLDPRPTDALGRPEPAAIGDAEALARWLQERSQLTVSTPAEVTVAGLAGWTVDIRGDAESPNRSEGCVTEGLCAAVFAYSTGGDERIYGASSADAIRLYLLDGIDHQVVIAVEARHSAPAGFLDGEAQELLDTLRLSAEP
jgi:hypothetical protein